jgi:nucleoside 2-deoxyribosyltransferase
MLKVYLAGSVKEVETIRKYKTIIRNSGIAVTSTWIDLNTYIEEDGNQDDETSKYYAKSDIEDIDAAHLLIFIRGENKSPGKTTEIGYALGTAKPIFFVGGRPYSVFHHDDSIYHWPDFETMFNWLTINKDIVASLLS